jgi:hypothetical protein
MRGTIAILVVGACAALAVPATPPSGEQIDKLIAQLGSSSFRQREAATKELEALGEPALGALKKATTSGDMEVANRAAALVERITNRLENARRLEPTYVNLTFKDTPVEEAFAELAKQSGFPITIGGDKSKLAERRVTLETGRVAFWVAFEKLREQGGLSEAESSQLGFPPPGYPQTVPLAPAPIQLQPARILVQPAERLAPAEKADPPAKEEAPRPREKTAEKPAPKPVQPPAKPEPPAPKAEAPAPPPPIAPPAVQFRLVDMRSTYVPAQQSVVPTLVVVDSTAKPPPTYIEGAVRIRSTAPMPNGPPNKPNELNACLLVQAEPRVAMERIIGVKITKAIDNEGQSLDPILAESIDATRSASDLERAELLRRRELLMAQRLSSARAVSVAHHGMAPVRLGKGHKESTELRELEGSVTIAARSPVEELAVIENPVKAKAGTSAKGKGDVQLKLVDMKRLENGDYEVQFDIQYSYEIAPAVPQPGAPGAAPRLVLGAQGAAQAQAQLQVLQAQAQFNGPRGPSSVANVLGVMLIGDKDQPLHALIKEVSSRNRGTIRSYAATVIFRANDNAHGEPAKLVFRGSRPMQVEVPFVLNDVPLK